MLTFYTGCGVASVKMGYLLLPTMVFLLTNSRSLAVFWCTACFALQGLTVIADLFKPFGICEGAEAHLTPQVATCFFFFFEVGTLWKLLGMTILTDSPKERAMGLLLQERATRASFMATFSHDMRTPLHALLSAVDLVDHSTLDSELRVTFDIISSCARLLRSLLASTFQLSQFENGQEVLPIALAPLSVRAIYDSVVDTIRIKERSGNTQYHKQCYYSFKTEILEEIVLVDLPKLLQALSNIIFNAYKHAEPLEKLRGDIALVSVELAIVDSQKGGEKLAQHCVAAGNRSDAEEYLIFFVEDRGAGVAKEDRAHIFNRYTTASSSSSPHRSSSNDSDIPAGAGLGLHICRLIIMQMGGALGVMGRRDGEQGACFWLTIPFVKTIQDLHEDEQLLTQVDQVMKLRSAIGPTDGGILEIKVGGNKKLSSERESHVVQELEQESRAGKVNETKSSGKARRGKNRKATENLDGLLHGKRIVVVDDNKMNLLVMERQLSVLGSPSVMQFTDAREALAFLTREAVEGAESGVCLPDLFFLSCLLSFLPSFFLAFFLSCLLSSCLLSSCLVSSCLLLTNPLLEYRFCLQTCVSLQCPVLVLCDLHMPQMSGLEFVLALKSSARRHIPCGILDSLFFFLFLLVCVHTSCQPVEVKFLFFFLSNSYSCPSFPF